jgi:hypothetical protein
VLHILKGMQECKSLHNEHLKNALSQYSKQKEQNTFKIKLDNERIKFQNSHLSGY